MTREEASELLADWFEWKLTARESKFSFERNGAQDEAAKLRARILDAMTAAHPGGPS